MMGSEGAGAMPIAVIGFGCRFPGDVTNGEKLWDMLMKKTSARSEVPADRYNVDSFYHPDGDRYGTTNNRGGHYLTEDVSLFDAPFFSISPAEAMAMDPMQRLLLEVTYEALENSGTPISKVSGTNTSCYVGCFTKDYEEMQRRDMELAPKYQSTGASQTILSNRLSYFFDLKGPSVSLDTACSSGLVAVHLACQSLRTGESSMAIAGGSNLILSPDIQIEMSDMHFLSPDSISYTFDDRANGYARGEGVGAIILKPLDLALRDNDPIRAVIRGTASSSDGKTPGITMPSKQAQIDLIKSAYRTAGCDVSETGYFEAHGTGTATGDPIETGTIAEVFAENRPLGADGAPIKLPIGSIKTNIGHLEGASGIAGLIKAVLSVEKGVIAPNIWFERANPAIDLEQWRLQVPTSPVDWPLDGLRRASVNSFGYGGTNAHVILDDAQHYLHRHRRSTGRSRTDSGFVSPISDTSADNTRRSRIFFLSANDERSLISSGESLAAHLKSHSVFSEESYLNNLAYTLNERRSRLSYQTSLVADTTSDLESKLCDITPTSNTRTSQPRLGYIFTGQGAQWWGMGRELLHYPVFKSSLRECDAIIRSLGATWSLMDELLKDKETSRVNEATFSQPLCTALQIALVDLLRSWKVYPHSVVGHSSGEIAAAYATGAFSAAAAIKIAYYRGLLSPKVKSMGYQGRMMAVALSEYQAIEEIQAFGDQLGKVVVACVNSPRSVTISGDGAAIEALQKNLDGKGIFARLLQVDTAYHSHHMQVIADEYLAHLNEADIVTTPEDGHVAMFSSVTEDSIAQIQLGPQYWVSNLVGTVRFSEALKKMCIATTSSTQGADFLLEIGPHALFKLPTREILEEMDEKTSIRYIPTLVRNKAADSCILEAVGQLVTSRYPADLHAINYPTEPKHSLSVLTDLPQYQWNHTRRYWCESRLSRDYRFRRFARTDILGAPNHDWNPLEPRFRNFMRLREQPWLRDHVVQGDVLFPACGYICMAIEACRQMSVIAPSSFLPNGNGAISEYRLREVSIMRGLVVPEADEGIETCFSMKCSSGNDATRSVQWHEFRIFSHTADNGWAENCRGLISVSSESTSDDELATSCLQEYELSQRTFEVQADPKEFYENAQALGLTYGPLFKGLQEIKIGQPSSRAIGTIEVSNTQAENPKEFEHTHLLHPATLDCFLQLALAALGGDHLTNLKDAMVPTFMEEISISASIAAQTGDKLNVYAEIESYGAREAEGNIFALDPITSKPVVLVDGFKFVAINGVNESTVKTSINKHCYTSVWEPDVDFIPREALNGILQTAPRPDDRPKTVRELELLSYYFIDQALQAISKSEVQDMLPHHQKFYTNLRKLREDVRTKVHPQQTEEWQQLHSEEVTAKLHDTIEHYRNHETAYDGKLLVRVGEALPLVFRQEVEPLALMTHENLLEDYYTTAVGMPNTYAQITRYVEMLTHKNPNLNFLEIGAGTGGATVPTLAGLRGKNETSEYPRLQSYTYTDISSYFFQRAGEKFGDLAQFMNFKKLDVEQDPESQGFVPGSYDVIVAANVLHATSDMHRTMTHARKLLRPGGRLILLEMTNRLLAASVIFGTLPGWWNASEEWRDEGPLLTESQWTETLLATGFSDLQASSPDVADPLQEGTRLMIATAIEPGSMPSNGLPAPPENAPITILCTDSPVKMNRLDIPLALKAKLDKAGLQTQIKSLSKVTEQDISGSICYSFVELEEPLLAEVSTGAIKKTQNIAETSAGLVWITRGASSLTGERPELAVFRGLARTLRAEHENTPCISIDLDDNERLKPSEVANLLLSLYEKRFRHVGMSDSVDDEFMEKGGILHVKRAIEDTASNVLLTGRSDPTALSPRLESLKQGDRALQLAKFNHGSENASIFSVIDGPSELRSDEVEIEVQATSLHRRDAQILNDEPENTSIGQECAGIVTKVGSSISHISAGDLVVAWCSGTLATHIRTPASFMHKTPSSMKPESATICPVAYSTAYHVLVELSRIESGETVLIHEASTAVGQAAIQIAAKLGATIFLTASPEANTNDLSARYNIDKARIFSSQDIKFVAALRRATKGRGVDVILNTLSGELLQASFSCITSFGRFVNLNADSAKKNERLEMAPFARNVSFFSVDMNLLYAQKPKRASGLFEAAMDFVEKNSLPGLEPAEVRSFAKLSEAVSIVKNTKEDTSVVLVPSEDDTVLIAQTPPAQISLDANATYLLAGGLGGLGRSIAQYLVTHGARHLIFVSRSGAASPEASSFITSLLSSGIHTAVLKCDISDALALSIALSTTLSTFPPIRGVIQGAMALNDSLFSTMTHEQWTSTLLPKVHGSKNLHETTLSQPLDFFILLSSLHSFIGNPGQANYAAGCAYQVALAEYRVAQGLPGTAIDLGIVGDVGYVVEKQESGKKVKVQDFKHLSEVEMLALVELGITQPMKGHIVTGLDSELDIASMQDDGLPFFARDPVLSHVCWLRPHLRTNKNGDDSEGKNAPSSTSAANVSLATLLATSTNPQEMHAHISTALLKKLSRSLMMSTSELDVSKPLSAYGTDSLVAVELKNWVMRETKVGVSVFDILQSSSIASLVERIVEKVEGEGGKKVK